MTTTAICLAAALGAVALIIVAVLVFSPPKEPSKPQGKGDEGVSVSAGEGSIVTVRKVGRMTSVTIRSSVHDHWEGSDSIQVPMIPVEVTRLEKPDLYAEYLQNTGCRSLYLNHCTGITGINRLRVTLGLKGVNDFYTGQSLTFQIF